MAPEKGALVILVIMSVVLGDGQSPNPSVGTDVSQQLRNRAMRALKREPHWPRRREERERVCASQS